MGIFKSALSKIKSGLARTRAGFVSQLRQLLTGKRLSEDLIRQVEAQLIQADVGVATTQSLIASLQAAWKSGQIASGDQALDHLKRQLAELWPEADRRLHTAEPGSGPTVILVTGINGAGKTTSIAKIAKSLRDEDKSVMLAACDTFRAAAVEQLEIWSQRLGVSVIKGQQGGDPAAVAFDACEAALARDVDVLIVDTAGRLHTQGHLMRQLTKIRDVCAKKIPGPRTKSCSSSTRPSARTRSSRPRSSPEAIDVTGLFLAKLDGTAKGGMVVAIHEQLGIPVKFIGVGETPDDVEPFEPEKFVEALFA